MPFFQIFVILWFSYVLCNFECKFGVTKSILLSIQVLPRSDLFFKISLFITKSFFFVSCKFTSKCDFVI